MLNFNSQNPKQYDLEERTFLFAKKVREFVRKLPKCAVGKRKDGTYSGSNGINEYFWLYS